MRYLLLPFFLLLSLILVAQVGVNTADPQQALDVNGKIRLADDPTTPLDGTMRFSATEGEFQGFSGGQWNSFSTVSGSGLPKGAEPVYGYLNNVNVGTDDEITFYRWTSSIPMTEVPEGKYLLVMAIYPEPNALVRDRDYDLSFYPLTVAPTTVQPARGMTIFGNTSVPAPLMGDGYPVIILGSGQTLRVYNNVTSKINMRIIARGFLVDSLEF